MHAASGREREECSNLDLIESKIYALGDFVDTDAVSGVFFLCLGVSGETLTLGMLTMFEIIPAAFILESPTDALLGSHALEFTNPDFRDKVSQGMRVVVAGKAFGCGSSREEAPRALKGMSCAILCLKILS
jgi:3-isopropylmalate dehydratase small subunit